MKTITEYIQKKHITSNIDLTNLFVDGDVVRKSNFEEYVKFADNKYRNVVYIKREDLLNADFDTMFKTLQKMFLEYGSIIFISCPMKYTNCNFTTCCSISIMTNEVEDIYDNSNDVKEIITYFQNKK